MFCCCFLSLRCCFHPPTYLTFLPDNKTSLIQTLARAVSQFLQYFIILLRHIAITKITIFFSHLIFILSLDIILSYSKKRLVRSFVRSSVCHVFYTHLTRLLFFSYLANIISPRLLAVGREGRCQAGPKGHRLEVGARRAPKLLVYIYIIIRYTYLLDSLIAVIRSLCSLSNLNQG